MKSVFIEKLCLRRNAAFWWLYASTVALACVHAGQSIVFHNALPGDLADSRLVNCILEHVYQCLRGHGEFFSPGQFFPIKGTLVYCDTHFGTVLFYALFRVIGLSMEGAFEGWILLMLSFNTIALLFLLRQLQVHPFIACALAFFGVSSSAFIFKTIHPQVLPFFPFVFCLAFTCKFLHSTDARYLAWAGLWFAYQNCCYLYFGYFAIYICGIIIALYLALFSRREFWHRFLRSVRQHWLLVSSLLALSLSAMIAIYLPYARFSAVVGTHPMVELADLAPNPGAWFSASPFSLFYAKQHFYKPGANMSENTLFSGWLFWLLTPVITATAFRHRKEWDMKLALVLITTVVLLIAAITTWNNSGSNIYLMFAERLPSIRAFRSFARINCLLIVVEAAVLAFFFNRHYRHVRSAWGKRLIVLFACLVPAENLALGQFSYAKSAAQQRAAAMVQMWKAAGGREVLVFAPGCTNQSYEYIHPDCWLAALLLRKKTVNGYSGKIPPSHIQFIVTPTEENAMALLASLNIPREICSIVTDWPEPIKQAFNIRTYHPAGRAAVLTDVKTIKLARLQSISVPVSVHSDEVEDLDCDLVKIYASYRLFDQSGTLVSDPPSIRTKVHLLRHGENKSLPMTFRAPSAPGTYEARLSMVHEGVAWWADRGSPGSVVKVIVPGSSKYELGRAINFGKGRESERFRVAGWSHTEDQMTWTEGSSAVLNFSGLPPSEPLTIKMTMNGLTKGAELPAQPTEVYANGKKIADWQVAEKNEYLTFIPADVVSDTGSLRIEFRLPKATSPQSLGLNADLRVLGICVFNLVIDKRR
jgi:hypothetical protein